MSVVTASPTAPPANPEPTLSPWARTAAVFARPTRAWTGLRVRRQWWFPLLLTAVVSLAGYFATLEKAQIPTMRARMEQKIEAGEMPPEMADRVERQMHSPIALAFSVVAIVAVVLIMNAAIALVPWLGAGFVLGRPFSYGDAFAVATWAGLVRIPAEVLFYALAWINGTMSGVHIGFGVLLPSESGSKLLSGLGTFLDYGIGPFYLWFVAVMVLGTAALSGAPRRSVAWTVGGLWVALMAVLSVCRGLFFPTA